MSGAVGGMKEQWAKFKADVEKKLQEPNKFTDILGTIEEKTKISRFNQVAGLAGLFALYLIFGYFAELVCNCIGFLYPAYQSIKALESPSKDDDTQWLTYWVVFGIFTLIEFAADVIFSWFPLYWVVKVIFMLYLSLPMFRGAEKVYGRFVKPFFQKHQSKIDNLIGKAATSIREEAEELREKGI